MTGIELIAKERKEQIEKHGWTKDHDAEHTDKSLVHAAIFVLTKGTKNYPKSWGLEFRDKLLKKEGIEALKVAGALLAAEIDRLIALEKKEKDLKG